MKSATISVNVLLPLKDVFEFVANPENMPLWAVNLCKQIRRNGEGDGWIVTTPRGDVEFSVVADTQFGIVDFHWRTQPGIEAVAPTRVVPNGEGSEYVFTMFQEPGMSEEQFKAGTDGLREELDTLKRILERRE